MVQCSNGHFFNSANGACPHCSIAENQQGKTVGINPNGVGANQWSSSAPNINAVQPFPLPNKLGQVNATPIPQDRGGEVPSNEGKTVGLYMKKEGIDPVVGWLVCIDGNDRGKDYRIHTDKNAIGRSEKNDITISGDSTISRENHATIVYDPKKRQFRLLAGGGRGLVYLNDEAVDFGSVLKENDTIEIGETKLLFVPFCGDNFNW